MQTIIFHSLHNITYSSVCVVALLVSKRYLLKNGGHFCLFYLWLLPLFALCNPFSVIIESEWSIFQHDNLISQASKNQSWLYFGITIWIIGALASIVYLIRKKRKLLIHLEKLVTDPSDPVHAIFIKRKEAIQIKQDVRLYTVSGIITPMLISAKYAMVLIPKEDIPLSDLELIFDHELYHLKYGDTYIKAIGYFARAIFWWNPFIYLVIQQMNEACEITCDYRVLKNRDDQTRIYYSQVVLNYAKVAVSQRNTIGSAAFNSGGVLKRRFKLMLKPTQKVRRTPVILFAILMLSLSFITVYRESPIGVPSTIVGGSFSVVQRIDGLFDIYDQAGNLLFFGVDEDIMQSITG